MQKFYAIGLLLSLLAWGNPAAAQLNAWQGNQKLLVLLLEWSDVPATLSSSSISADLFSTDTLSLNQFLIENSHGKASFSGDVREWRKSRISWANRNGCDLDPILNEAWNLFGADIDISQYDSDHDGKIDNLFIIHSGRIQSDRVGPDCVFTEYSRANYAAVFQSQGVGSQGNALAVGFYLHEGGHLYYGFPDLYGQHFYGRYGIGMWGMMGLGAWGVNNQISADELFRYPSHFEPKSKEEMGWGEVTSLRQTTMNVALNPIEVSGEFVAVRAPGGSTFYLENRSPVGFSANAEGHGLLIWDEFQIIQADGRDDLNHGRPLGRRPLPPITENFGDTSDPFPGSGNVTSYEDRSEGVKFQNIRIENGVVKLDVIFGRVETQSQKLNPFMMMPSGSTVNWMEYIERL